jgi:excinuclease UvrABC ATPase subunit
MTEYIEIRGARENNLKDITLRIPKRQITIFTGVSGSGKSSIVFDTIATEAQRQLYENFSLFVRSFLPKYPPPEADAIENLSMAVNRRSETAWRRVALHRRHDHGHLHAAAPAVLARRQAADRRVERLFVQRSRGMCRECGGLGRKMGVAWESFIDKVEIARRGRDPGAVLGAVGSRRLRGVGVLRQEQEAIPVHKRRDGSASLRQRPQVQDEVRVRHYQRHLPRRR